MTTTTRHSYKLSVKRATRRRRRRRHPQNRRPTASSIGPFKPMQGKCKSIKLSQKLEALKNLIPTHSGDAVKPDQLFKETAEYIVLLRTRVVVLQKLVEYYGNSNENENVVLL
ncbi:hypothetical protein E2542_SST27650 [Spatholobus suberectus]|nr:hypothetical protein E2542_SST27650 [Spatholobus suberectus]